MSRSRPTLHGTPRPVNTAVKLRDTFVALNDLAIARLVERGHRDIRPAHAAVFQYLDDRGTTVSALAERAQMTKQAMAELVQRLEALGYVVRVADPGDRRAKLVTPTDSGAEVIAIAQAFAAELEQRLEQLLGTSRFAALQRDLDTIAESASREADDLS